MKLLNSLLTFATLVTNSQSTISGCDNGISCSTITLDDLTFDCRFAGDPITSSNNNVMLLHGFPEWSSMYMDFMRKLAENGYHSVACNLRGYSPSASPDGESNYNYNTLASDVDRLASSAFNNNPYHLIGHDHGGILGWIVAGRNVAANILSYASLSSPHPDAFSDGLYGDAADIKQVEASQYFTMFTLEDSATIENKFWWYTTGLTAGTKYGEKFDSPEDFQKSLWWYNGAKDAGVMAMPPIMSTTSLLKDGAWGAAFLRGIYGGEPDDGIPAVNRLGNVQVPSLFICGGDDDAILCSRDYAKKSGEFVENADYEYFEVKCGHDLLSCKESDQVMDKLLEHVQRYSSRKRSQ